MRDPDSGALASDSEVLAVASGKCFAWDGGAVMPANLNVLFIYSSRRAKQMLQNGHLLKNIDFGIARTSPPIFDKKMSKL